MLVAGNLVLLGIGYSLFSSPNTNAVMSSVDKRALWRGVSHPGPCGSPGICSACRWPRWSWPSSWVDSKSRPPSMSTFCKACASPLGSFAVLCVGGIFASLARGRVRFGLTPAAAIGSGRPARQQHNDPGRAADAIHEPGGADHWGEADRAATARLMASEGGAVDGMERTAQTVEQTVQQIREKGGGGAGDRRRRLRKADEERAVEQAVKTFGRLDIVVSNAGIQLHKRDKPIHEQELDAWEETQGSTSAGRFLVCRAGVQARCWPRAEAGPS